MHLFSKSSLCLTRLKTFSKCLSGISRACTMNGHFNCFNHFAKQTLIVQRVSNFYCSTHTSCDKLGNDNVSEDFDPDLQEFNNAYEIVRKAMCHTNDKALVDAMNWSVKVLDFNVQGGKKSRGVAVLKAFKILTEEEISSDRLLQACILGWCLELLQGFFLVCDDIMDNSTVRRGKPCWYKMPDVGLIAINDGIILEHSIYKLLKFYFGKSDVYNNILNEFLQITYKTVCGQCLDMLNSPPNSKPRFENFNLEKYYAVAEYKTAFYTFCLPVHLSMHLVGNFSENDFNASRNIGLKLGRLFQIQDDYFDCFGDPNVTGKNGTDVIDGKCTWFSASFFEQAPDYMKEIMKENYGVNTEDAVSKVMKMYKELNLVEKYYECQESSMREITLMINNLSTISLQKVFFELLKKVYQRKK